MESEKTVTTFGDVFQEVPMGANPGALVVCEHASNRVPPALNRLGLSATALESHIAWDPGAKEVANALAKTLNGVLLVACISRLVYDCNRPPDAASAIPDRSEVYDIPGNTGLSADARAERVAGVYTPFRAALSRTIRRYRSSLACLITVHSFTPVFNGATRGVELGVLHGRDDRLAREMMRALPDAPPHDTRLNAPYSAADGVTHTLDLHGAANNLPNVMIEIRNDLIRTDDEQRGMAAYLGPWIMSALAACGTGDGS
jgi:predicted N-formylglutamate amidohydrolase